MTSGGDEIEVLATLSFDKGQVRIRENFRTTSTKCSILLTAAQLEEHAKDCLALAAKLRAKEAP